MKYKFSDDKIKHTEENEFKWFTDREKEAFKYFFVRGWTIENIAAEMDLSRSTVSRLLKRVRDKIS